MRSTYQFSLFFISIPWLKAIISAIFLTLLQSFFFYFLCHAGQVNIHLRQTPNLEFVLFLARVLAGCCVICCVSSSAYFTEYNASICALLVVLWEACFLSFLASFSPLTSRPAMQFALSLIECWDASPAFRPLEGLIFKLLCCSTGAVDSPDRYLPLVLQVRPLKWGATCYNI